MTTPETAALVGSSRHLSIGLVFGLLVASCAPAPSPKWPHGDDGFAVSAIAYWDATELLKRARVLFRQGNHLLSKQVAVSGFIVW